jgi:hypothetical protein
MKMNMLVAKKARRARKLACKLGGFLAMALMRPRADASSSCLCWGLRGRASTFFLPMRNFILSRRELGNERKRAATQVRARAREMNLHRIHN